jgi:hypothetical protein
MKHEYSHATIGLAAAAVAAALLAAVAFAQDTSPTKVGEVGQRPGEGNPAPAGEVGQRPGEGNAKAGDGKPKADAASTPPTASKSSPQRFEPTEKVRPDFDVAFPVDI